jgi:hypothetical protein
MMRLLLNTVFLAVLLLGSFGVTSPARAFCNDSFFYNQCGTQCISVLDSCCNSGNWHCPQGTCYIGNGYFFCCPGWAQGTTQGQCRGPGGTYASTAPVQ